MLHTSPRACRGQQHKRLHKRRREAEHNKAGAHPGHAHRQHDNFAEALSQQSHRDLKGGRRGRQSGFEEAHLGVIKIVLDGDERQDWIYGDKTAVINQVHECVGN